MQHPTHAQYNARKPMIVRHAQLERAVAVRLLRDEMQALGFSQADIDGEIARRFTTTEKE